MPSRFAWKNWKAPCALVFILAVIITALFFAPPLVPLPAPKPYDRNQDIIFHLKHSQQIPSLTSTDLYRFREIHREHIVPPADVVQAEAFLKQIESLWSELQEIAKEQDFRREGFASHTRLGDWKRRIDALYADPPNKTVVGSDIHGLPGKLIAVGIDYAINPLLFDTESVLEEWFVNYYLPMAQKSVQSQD